MKIQNISGITQAFTFSNVISQTLANNAYMVLPDDPEVYADAMRFAAAGWLSITEGPALSSNIQSVGQPASIEVVLTANATDTNTVTVNGNIFEYDNNAAVTAGRTAVTIGASAKLTLDDLSTKMLANSDFAGWRKLGCTVHEGTGAVLLMAIPSNVDIADVTVSETMAAGTIKKREAVVGDSFGQLVEFRTVATLPDDLIFVTPLRSIKTATVEVRTSAGVVVAWDGVARFDGGIVTLDNSGDVDIASTNVIFLQAIGLQ
jgi:hypothetical protein